MIARAAICPTGSPGGRPPLCSRASGCRPPRRARGRALRRVHRRRSLRPLPRRAGRGRRDGQRGDRASSSSRVVALVAGAFAGPPSTCATSLVVRGDRRRASPGSRRSSFVQAVRLAGAARTAVLIGVAPLLSFVLAAALPRRGHQRRPDRGRGADRGRGRLALVRAHAAGGLPGARRRARRASAPRSSPSRDTLVRWGSEDATMEPLLRTVVSLGGGRARRRASGRWATRSAPPAAGPARRRSSAFLPAGLMLGAAYVCLIVALDRGRVTIVAPLNATQSLWGVIFAAAFLGRREAVGPRLLAAAVRRRRRRRADRRQAAERGLVEPADHARVDLSRDREPRARRRRLRRGGRRPPPRSHRGPRRAQRVHHDRSRAQPAGRPLARGAGPARGARRRAVRAQGPVRHRRPAHDLRLRALPRPRADAHGDRRPADRRRRRRDRRQGQPARVRVGRDEQEPVLRHRRQPAAPRAHRRRLLGRQRGGALGRARRAQHRHRHGRLDPHPVLRLRHRGLQAEPRARADRRLLPARARLRPRRADGAHDGGVRARARGARRPAAPRAAPRRPARRRARRDRGHGAARGLRGALRGGGAARPGSTRCRSSRRSARTRTASSTPARRDEYSRRSAAQDGARLRADGGDVPRALGRGRGLARPLRARAALRHPRRPDPAVRAAARRGGGERGVPRARDRLGAAVQLARLAVGDDARRR